MHRIRHCIAVEPLVSAGPWCCQAWLVFCMCVERITLRARIVRLQISRASDFLLEGGCLYLELHFSLISVLIDVTSSCSCKRLSESCVLLQAGEPLSHGHEAARMESVSQHAVGSKRVLDWALKLQVEW